MVLDIHTAHVSVDNSRRAKRMQTTTSSKSTKAHTQALFTCLPKGGSENTKVVREILVGRRGGTVGRWSLRDNDQHYNRISSDGIVTRLRGRRPRNYN